MNENHNEALEKYKLQCRNSGMSEDEINRKVSIMKDLLTEEKPERFLTDDELQILINDIAKRKSLFRSVVFMTTAAIIGAISIGPLLFLLSVSLKFLLFAIVLIPGTIAGIGMATYYKSSLPHKICCSALSLFVVFPIYLMYDITSAIAEFGFTKTFDVVGSKFQHILYLSFENTFQNTYAVYGGVIMAALSFHICNGKIDNGDIRSQAVKAGMGNVGFQWPNNAILLTSLVIALVYINVIQPTECVAWKL